MRHIEFFHNQMGTHRLTCFAYSELIKCIPLWTPVGNACCSVERVSAEQISAGHGAMRGLLKSLAARVITGRISFHIESWL